MSDGDDDSPPAPVEALLFDLGGVVVDIDFARAFRHWAPLSQLSADEIAAAFCFDEAYERHERGEIEAPAYFASLRSRLRLDASDAAIAAGWNAIFVAEIPETVALVRRARRAAPCYGFSNSNRTHRMVWASAFADVVASFERVFVSCDIGWRKPEREAFEWVAGEIDVAPARILFFDDTIENVDGARAAGLAAVHVRSPSDVRDALRGAGCAD